MKTIEKQSVSYIRTYLGKKFAYQILHIFTYMSYRTLDESEVATMALATIRPKHNVGRM